MSKLRRLIGRRRHFVGSSRLSGRLARFPGTRLSGKRPLIAERLEDRMLLAGNVFHNSFYPVDVNANGQVEPLDALVVINYLNMHGSGSVGSSAAPTAAAAEGETSFSNMFIDVNGDNLVSPADALFVINALNGEGEGPPLVGFRLETTDLNGNAISEILVGQDFELRVYVQDVQQFPASPNGVFAAYLDVKYDNPDLFSIVFSEIQTLTLNKKTTGGTYSIDYPGVGGVNDIQLGTSFSQAVANLTSAYESLFGTGNIEVTRVPFVDPEPGAPNSNPFIFEIRFIGDLIETDVPNGTADGSGLTTSDGSQPFADLEETAKGVITDPQAFRRSATPGPDYPNGLTLEDGDRDAQGQVTDPNVLSELGAFDGFGFPTETKGDERLLVKIPFNANDGGVVTFTPDPADDSSSKVLLFDRDDINPIQPMQINYGSSISLTINQNVDAVDDPLYAVMEDSGATDLDVLTNDVLNVGSSLSIKSFTQPPAGQGVVSPGPGNTLTYTTDTDFAGTTQFQYTIENDLGDEDTATVTVNVMAVNDAPQFTKGADQNILEDAGAQAVAAWATGIAPGPATALDEAGQTLTFQVNTTITSGNLTFATAPAIDPATGNLTYETAADTNGTAQIEVALKDNGGTANGGVDTSPVETFTISVAAVNDAPLFAGGADESILEDAGPQTVTAWATGMAPGPATATDESGQTLTFQATVTGTTGNLVFVTPPAINAATGTLTYQAAPDTNGQATVEVSLQDNGGTANGGVNTSDPHILTITVAAVNDAPQFTAGPNQQVDEDAGLQTVSGWATAIAAGPAAATDESGQVLTFVATVVSTTGNLAFDAAPAINASTGTLTYQSAADTNGTATVQVVLQDNGGTADGGSDTSPSQQFMITVNAINDAPVNVVPGEQVSDEIIDLVFSAANNNLIEVTDVDAGSNPVQVTLALDSQVAGGPGILTLASTSNLNVTGDGTANITMTGSIDAINQALNGMAYTPPGVGFIGLVTLTITTNDQGNSGEGGPLSDTDTVDIEVLPSQRPRARNDSFSILEDASTLLNVLGNDFASTGATLYIMPPLMLPAGFVGMAEIEGDQVRYTPPADFVGQVTFGYEINDTNTPNNDGPDTATVTVNVMAVNDAPQFTAGADQNILEDAGPQLVAGWATGIVPGPATALDEVGQTLTFQVNVNVTSGNLAFIAAPAIDSATGNLTYQTAADTNGTALVEVSLKDNGGTNNGGVDTSAIQSFSINVAAVNDAPQFTKGSDQTIDEDAGTQTVPAWATGIARGPATATDETGQTLAFNLVVNVTSGNLVFDVSPTIDPATGDLTYRAAANSNGTATVDVTLEDNGGTANGGVDTSPAQSFTITVQAINDAPVNSVPPPQTTMEDTPLVFNSAHDNRVSISDADATGQVHVMLSVVHGVLAVPGSPDVTITGNGTTNLVLLGTVDAINAALDGQSLTYTPDQDYNGSDELTVTTDDQGGSGSGGPQSDSDTVSITIREVNDPPTAGDDGGFLILKNGGAQTIAPVLDNDSPGPANESGQQLTIDMAELLTAGAGTVEPSADGKSLIYTPATDFEQDGVMIRYRVTDNGTTAGTADPRSTTAIVTVDVVEAFTNEISGSVYFDANRNGKRDTGERGIAGVEITLTGVDIRGNTVNLTVKSQADGSYVFAGILPNDPSGPGYSLTETHPRYLMDGDESIGTGNTAGGTPSNDHFSGIELDMFGTRQATDYDFGERGVRPEFITIAEILASTSYDGLILATNLAGDQFWHSVMEGWTGIKSAEIVLSQDLTHATLRVVDSADNVHVRQIDTATNGHFRIMGDDGAGGYVVRIDGTAADFGITLAQSQSGAVQSASSSEGEGEGEGEGEAEWDGLRAESQVEWLVAGRDSARASYVASVDAVLGSGEWA